MTVETTPVLVVGGSFVGLATAAFLTSYGIRPLVVERHPGPGVHPRARGLNPRTMELFRGIGVEDRISAGTPPVTGNEVLIQVETLAGKEIRRIESSTFDGITEVTPSNWVSIGQDKVEPILRQVAEERGADIRYSTELVSFTQDADGVDAVIRDRATGEEQTVRAQYLVGADGHRSLVRKTLGIEVDELATTMHALSILFRADLTEALRGREVVMAVALNPQARFGVLTPVEDDQWMYGIRYDPAKGETADQFTEDDWVTMVRAAVGDPELEVKVELTDEWEVASRIAQGYQTGRVFLAGDSAHLMPPAGGFGANTGAQDAQNLAWKLALVLQGTAGPGLLDTYDAERRPAGRLTVNQSAERTAARKDEPGGDEEQLDELTVMFGYRYSSGAVIADSSAEPGTSADPRTPTGLPGTRAAHIAIDRNGKRLSTVDLFGRGFVLLAGEQGHEWIAAARALAASNELVLTAYRVGSRQSVPDLVDLDDRFPAVYGVAADGAVLVRPDGFVAWRGRPGDGDLAGVIEQVLHRGAQGGQA
ncbi:FAD-dependent monooxygenase [Kibdelosporangium phytohabitans]|uniref:FAD-binding domain-containing protein n=1 Tax=Kibdelosporangium phytohabitans TaxID=860235 RepID=A0A0N9I7P0_9PSEU|nr:FAD-dependent monooxygenase [Kibdelosporangium phytohabitans]ALG10922.1 hypothetical protein AOZ06_32145 [Kibdelosporangium phytohabitans]MBE1462113.1 putative polyketide hydroxylase [Kibdelosporangium phytohabitans]